MKNKLILSTLTLLLAACQSTSTTPSTTESASTPTPQHKVFNVVAPKHLRQNASQQVANGWLYSLVDATEADKQREKIVVVELTSTPKPFRLKQLFPANCHELAYSEKTEQGYMTWRDILHCPQYDGEQQGILVVNKAIRDSNNDKLYGATFYKILPAHKQVKRYQQLPLSAKEITDISDF